MRTASFVHLPAARRLAALYAAVVLIVSVMLYRSIIQYPPARLSLGDRYDTYTTTENGSRTFIRDEKADAIAAGFSRLVYIDLDRLYLLIYRNGQQVRAFPCSGGKAATPSPYGQWKIVSKDTWGDGFGGYWLELNVPWGKYGIHGTSKPWFIGRHNVSKGCIRLYSEDAKDLYALAPCGTTVIIVNENRPFRIMRNGMVGSDVRDVQIALKALHYYEGPVDGKFGKALAKSVISFQKKNMPYVSGHIDKKTYDLIMSQYGQFRDPLE